MSWDNPCDSSILYCIPVYSYAVCASRSRFFHCLCSHLLFLFLVFLVLVFIQYYVSSTAQGFLHFNLHPDGLVDCRRSASARGFIYSGSGSGSTDLILFKLLCFSHLHLFYLLICTYIYVYFVLNAIVIL